MNRKLTLTEILIAAFVVIVLVALLVPMLCSPTSRAPRVGTISTIKQVDLAIRMLELEIERPLKEILPADSGSADLNAALVAQLTNHSIIPATTRITSSVEPIHLIDAWGQPLQIAWRHQLTNLSAFPQLGLGTNSLIVWSIGPDRTNDYGNNDDVRFSRHDYVKMLEHRTDHTEPIGPPNSAAPSR